MVFAISGFALLKILHVIASVDPKGGGPIEGLLQMAARRPPEDFVVHVASLDAADAPHVTACPVKTFALGEPRATEGWRRRLPWVHYGYAPRLVPWLRAHIRDYDVVVVEGLWNYATLAARRALVGSGVPYVVFTHGMLDPWFRTTYPLKSMLKQLFWWFGEGPLLNNADAVLFTTEDERQVSRNAFRPYRVRERVVGFGTADIAGDAATQAAAFRAAVPALGARRYLLFLSRIHPKKGCDLLVEAFARIAGEDPGLDLVIAGPDQTGWRAALEARAATLGMAARIHWPGMLLGDAKWGAFRECEAFVLPSHQENFGVVVAEAMAAGKPVLLSDKVQIWREVVSTGAGLVEADTSDGTARLLRRFQALTGDERWSMAAAARATFLKRFEMTEAVAVVNQALAEAAGRATAGISRPVTALPNAEPLSECHGGVGGRARGGALMGALDASKVDTWRGGASFPLVNRLYRLVWMAVWLVFAAWTPPPLHGWRRVLLRAFGARVAPTAFVYGSTRIWSPLNLDLGAYSRIGPRVTVYSMALIRLDDYALVSQGAHLCAGTHDIEDVNFQLQARPIVIGQRAWVAAEAFVGPGVTVGPGAVLGARGCAFRDLAPWTVYAGNPARPLRPRALRFPDCPD